MGHRKRVSCPRYRTKFPLFKCVYTVQYIASSKKKKNAKWDDKTFKA